MARAEFTGDVDVRALRKKINKYKVDHDCKSQLEVIAEWGDIVERECDAFILLRKVIDKGMIPCCNDITGFCENCDPYCNSEEVKLYRGIESILQPKTYPINPNSAPAGDENEGV